MASFSVPPEDRAARRVGTILAGKYGIERVLGVGGMATVYMGVHRNGRRVAIKLLHEELGIHRDVRARFVREGYVANSVGHPGAVLVHDDDVAEDGAVFLVMELLLGETLGDRALRRGGVLPCGEVLALAHQLLAVLAAAHACGVVHRDIKPENLFLTTAGALKVLDFGVARMKTDAGGSLATATGARIGTPAFMPPEQALGRTSEIDARTDLWAAGATMFSLLAGRTVHKAESAAELIVITATTPPRSLAEFVPDLPQPVVDVVDRALSFARDDRWPDARTMQRALEEAHVEAFGEPLSPSEVGSLPQPQITVSRSEDERETDPVRRDQTTMDAGPPTPRSERAVAADSERTRRSEQPPSASTKPDPTLSPATRRLRPSERPPGMTSAALSKPEVPRRGRLIAAAGLLAALAAGVIYGISQWSAGPGDSAASGASVTVAAAGVSGAKCAVNADCKGDRPAICRKQEGICVALETDQCKVLASPGDVENDATVWIGAMFPLSATDSGNDGQRSGNAVELARRDFSETTGGLPPAKAGGPKRPIAVVLCDDRESPERAAAHLVHDVRVPAILGFARSKEVMDLASALFLPNGVLALAANTASALRDIPRVAGGPRLVWRVTTSSDMIVPAAAAVVSEVIEPAVIADPGALARGAKMRVALVRAANASGRSYADRLLSTLRFNGKSVIENGEDFLQIETPDSMNHEQEEDAPAVEKIRAFAPQLIFPMGGSGWLVPAIERAWPEHERFRPRYLKSSSNAIPEINGWVRKNPELRRRFYMVDATSSNDVLARYVVRYNEVFSPRMLVESATCAPYDAFYVLAYAAAALGEKPITGVALAGAISRLKPEGERIDVGPAGIYRAYYVLAEGKNIDLQGTMTSLDFNPDTGDATVDFSLYCLAPGSATEAPRAVESGVVFGARSRKLEGTFRCP